jgi:hypothetical protein
MELTGRETEPHDMIDFKFYKSQIPSLSRRSKRQPLCWGEINPEGTVWR